MKILTDEHVPRITAQRLRDNGHDVKELCGSPLAGINDVAVWELARQESRLLVTCDRSFGRRRNEPHSGLIVVRLSHANGAVLDRRIFDAVHEVAPERWRGVTIVIRDKAQTLYRTPDPASE